MGVILGVQDWVLLESGCVDLDYLLGRYGILVRNTGVRMAGFGMFCLRVCIF